MKIYGMRVIRVNVRAKSLVVLGSLAIALFGCRTAKPSSEVLDPASVRVDGDDATAIPLDTSADPAAAALWSPAQRRANATYQFLLAQKLLMQGDVARAQPLLESSYNLDPNSYTGSQLVKVRLAANDVDEAMSEAHRMTLLYPKDEKLLLLYGLVLSAKNDFRAAEIQFKKALDFNGKYEEAYLALARVYIVQKRMSDVTALVQKMTKEIPSSPQGWSLYSRLLLAAKKYKDALVPAKRAYDLQPNQPDAAFLYGLTLDLNGKSKEAVALYEHLVRANPANPELVDRMISLYRDLGSLEDGLALIDDMLARSSVRHPGLVIQRSLILWEMNRNQEASDGIEEMLKTNPESDRIAFLSGLGLERIGKFKEALERYSGIQNDSPLKLQAGYRRTLIFKQNKDIDAAIDEIRELTKRADADASTWQILIEILAEAKRFDDGREAAAKAAKLFPDKLQLLFLQGVYEERTGRTGDAERTMRSVIKADPNHASALNFLGYMLAEQNRDLDQAEAMIQRALKLKPDDGSYLDSLGWVLYQRKEYKKALEVLTKALAASPEEGVIMEHIGDVHLGLGDPTAAAQYYDKSLKTNLEDRDRTRIDAKFKELVRGMK